MDTIVALSSGRPPAAIGILRVSGPDAFAAGAALAGPLPAPRQATLRTLRDAQGAILDAALLIAFPGPTSATGEDMLELHCHGGRAVVRAVEDALVAWPGVRGAEPGEFTRRALANGRIDLAQAEGLADLLAAETEAQRRAAIVGAEGGISRRVRGWMDRLAALSARVEVGIDYADEDEAVAEAPLRADVAALAAEWRDALAAPPVERLRDGITVVLAGPPNSGKSTLINALAERDVAIVSPIAGTTRDRIEAPVMRAGVSFVLIDTAGLTETADAIEAAGVDLARGAMAAADIVLWLGDAPPPPGAIALHARADRPERGVVPPGRIAVSAATGEGMAALWTRLGDAAAALLPAGDAALLNRRQRALVAEALDELAETPDDLLLLAEHLRRAREALGRLLGVQATEAMLDALFGAFCLGK